MKDSGNPPYNKYLAEIVSHKRTEILSMSADELNRKRKSFNPLERLREKPFIAEVKKASPSMGEINTGVDPVKQAGFYANGGAGAVSVLTDMKYFKGSFDFLEDIGKHIDIPLLCKDFVLSSIQIEKAYNAGADFILLITAILDEEELMELSMKASSLEMKVLYEIHGIGEFSKIKKLNPEMVGVNSRDLKTFEINFTAAADTIRALKDMGDFIIIAESGIESPDDVRYFKNAGADAFLVGTALMKSGNPEKKLKDLYKGLSLSCS